METDRQTVLYRRYVLVLLFAAFVCGAPPFFVVRSTFSLCLFLLSFCVVVVCRHVCCYICSYIDTCDSRMPLSGFSCKVNAFN